MSLILRRDAQPVLDSVDLDDYHVEIHTPQHRWQGERVLMVAGPCGQQLFKIDGIQFSRANPVQKEIDYAVELLTEFFRMHKQKLDTFKRAQTAFSRVKDSTILKTENGFDVSVEGNYVSSIIFNDKTATLRYRTKDKNWRYDMHQFTRIGEIGALAKDGKLRAKMVTRAKEAQKYCDLRKTFNDAKQDLVTCNI